MIHTNEIVMTLFLMILLILHNMHEVFGTVEKLGNSTLCLLFVLLVCSHRFKKISSIEYIVSSILNAF